MASAKAIYEAGLKAFGDEPSDAQRRLLRAFAAMLATSRSTKKKTPQEPPTLPFAPQDLYELMLEKAGHIVACVPYDKRWFGRLGKELQATSGLTRDDLETFVGWVLAGGIDFMPDPSFSHVIKHWGTWITKARQWKASAKEEGGFEEWID